MLSGTLRFTRKVLLYLKNKFSIPSIICFGISLIKLTVFLNQKYHPSFFIVACVLFCVKGSLIINIVDYFIKTLRPQ